jgi:hypothetical protein
MTQHPFRLGSLNRLKEQKQNATTSLPILPKNSVAIFLEIVFSPKIHHTIEAPQNTTKIISYSMSRKMGTALFTLIYYSVIR